MIGNRRHLVALFYSSVVHVRPLGTPYARTIEEDPTVDLLIYVDGEKVLSGMELAVETAERGSIDEEEKKHATINRG